MSKKKNKLWKNVIKNLILLLFIVMFIYSGIKIIQWFLDNRKNNEISEEISKAITVDEAQENVENEEKYNVDFVRLKEKNSDTVGWLKVNGTNIEYAVVQGSDNSFYLTHNFNKSRNSAGWIFADYNNKLDGTDKNIVIYGHNMRDNNMFGELKNILTEDWKNNEENKKIIFITENDNCIYEVFSVYKIETEEYYITTQFSDEEFKEFITKIKSRSKFDFNVPVDENNQILTLSTCANNSNYRVVLHAKKQNR